MIVFQSWTITIKQHTNKLKIRILYETSILYLIRHASFLLIVGRRMLCWKKNSGAQRARISNLWNTVQMRSQLRYVGRHVVWDLNFYCTVLHCIAKKLHFTAQRRIIIHIIEWYYMPGAVRQRDRLVDEAHAPLWCHCFNTCYMYGLPNTCKTYIYLANSLNEYMSSHLAFDRQVPEMGSSNLHNKPGNGHIEFHIII